MGIDMQKLRIAYLACTVFLFGVCQALPQATQRPGPPGTIRVRVQLVPLDVIVTDSRDRPVTDLRQEDIQIFEDGREQEIRHFSIQSRTAMTTDPDEPPVLRNIPALELAPQPGRTFLFLMGQGEHQLFKTVDAAARFVRRNLLPQDRVAVYAYGRATDFTTNHESVAQVLDRYAKLSPEIEAFLKQQRTGLHAVYGTNVLAKSMQTKVDRIFNNEEGLGFRQPVPARLPGEDKAREGARKVVDAINRSSEAAAISPFDQLQFEQLGDISFAEFAAGFGSALQDGRDIYTCIQYMRFMEGEKHLFFYTSGDWFFWNGDARADNLVAQAASDARVAIDIFQTSGVPLRDAVIPGFVHRSWAIMGLRTITDLTGGQIAVYEDVGKALNRINESTRISYLMGYYPKNDHLDGRYRRIRVQVKRPGMKVSYRHGYYATERVQLYDREQFLAYSRIAGAAAYEQVVADVSFTARAQAVKEASGQLHTRLDIQIDPTRLGFKVVNDRHTDKLQIAVFYLFCNDKNQYITGEERKTVDLALLEETYQRNMQSSIPISILIPQSGVTNVKIIVYDFGSDRVGSAFIKVQDR